LLPESRSEHPVVTRVDTSPGGVVGNGALLCDVSGEPVVVFEGAFSPYRDLRVGDGGPDVVMLRAAVAALGV
jgi:hypothetical protein